MFKYRITYQTVFGPGRDIVRDYRCSCMSEAYDNAELEVNTNCLMTGVFHINKIKESV